MKTFRKEKKNRIKSSGSRARPKQQQQKLVLTLKG